VRSKVFSSPSVIGLAFDREVLTSVQLHCQLVICAVDVDDVGPNRMLAAKLQAEKLSHSQQTPQKSFSIGGASSKRATACECRVHDRFSEVTATKLRGFHTFDRRVIAPPLISG
jgi:hypothetical protein